MSLWALFQGAALPLLCAFPLTCSLHGPLAFVALVLPVTCTAPYFRDGLKVTFKEKTRSLISQSKLGPDIDLSLIQHLILHPTTSELW